MLDTNIVSYLMADVPSVSDYVASLRDGRLCTSVITRGEILFGIARMGAGARKSRFEAAAERVLSELPCEPLDSRAAEHYAELKRQRFATGRPLEDNDLWIASIAKASGAILITSDAAFESTEGLELRIVTAP